MEIEIMKNADLPAMPFTGVGTDGLTKREEFAKCAMAALLASGKQANIAQIAIKYADDLLEKLEETK